MILWYSRKRSWRGYGWLSRNRMRIRAVSLHVWSVVESLPNMVCRMYGRSKILHSTIVVEHCVGCIISEVMRLKSRLFAVHMAVFMMWLLICVQIHQPIYSGSVQNWARIIIVCSISRNILRMDISHWVMMLRFRIWFHRNIHRAQKQVCITMIL